MPVKSSNGILECNLCDRKFLSSSKFMKHQAKCTQETAPRRSRYLFQCEKCLQRFPIASNLYKHRKLYCEFGEPRPKKTYPCDGCLFEFTDKSNLRQHLRMNRCKGLQQKGNAGNLTVQNDGIVKSQSMAPQSSNEQNSTNVNLENISTTSCDNQSFEKANLFSEHRMGYHALFGGMVPGLVLGYPQNAYLDRDITERDSVPISNNLIMREMTPHFTTALETASESNATLDQITEQSNLVPSIENMSTSSESPSTPDVEPGHDTDTKDVKQEVMVEEPDYNPEVKKDKGI